MPSIRASRGRGGRRLKNDINVVPYIDVMLVLLVIFMVTAPLITPGLINLPTVGQADQVPATPVEVQVDQSGAYSIRLREAGAEFEPVAADQLVAQVRSRITPETPVVIAADGKAPYETVMKVMDELRANGVTRLGLLVDQSGGQSPAASPTQEPAASNARQ